MFFPVVPFAIAIALAGYGTKKAIDAYSDNEKARELNDDARFFYDNAAGSLGKCREDAKWWLEHLGKTKLALMQDVLTPFVHTFSRIKNVDYADMEVPEEVPKHVELGILEIRDITIRMEEAVGGTAGALGAGAMAGLAAYGFVGLLGTASTGAPIIGLSGVAATNATLAWFGGGPLAAGGMGIAGGTAVLGGIVAAPVLLVGGLVLASGAAKAKEDARSNLAKAKAAAEAMRTAEVAVSAIRRMARAADRVLLELHEYLEQDLVVLRHVVSDNDDYRTYSRRDKELVVRAVSLAVTAKNVAETPLLEEDGVVTDAIGEALRNAKKFLKQIKDQ